MLLYEYCHTHEINILALISGLSRFVTLFNTKQMTVSSMRLRGDRHNDIDLFLKKWIFFLFFKLLFRNYFLPHQIIFTRSLFPWQASVAAPSSALHTRAKENWNAEGGMGRRGVTNCELDQYWTFCRFSCMLEPSIIEGMSSLAVGHKTRTDYFPLKSFTTHTFNTHHSFTH